MDMSISDVRCGSRTTGRLAKKYKTLMIALCSAAIFFNPQLLIASPATLGWFLQPSATDVDGPTTVDEHGMAVLGRSSPDPRLSPCDYDVAKFCPGKIGAEARTCLTWNRVVLGAQCKVALDAVVEDMVQRTGGVPACYGAPICHNRLGRTNQDLMRVEWKQTLGYTFSYPFSLPPGGGVSGVGIGPNGNIWVLQRVAVGKPALFEFDKDHKMVRAIGDDVIGHLFKAHGIAVDSENNVWICDANGPVMKLSPEGRLLMTLGKRGERGDWDEAAEQRLLWQPQDVAFGKNGDVYIAEGHGNESPNDTDRSLRNNIGAARVIHLDKSGKFINQWYGNDIGPGKFTMAHAIAVDPRSGDVWIGDREQYRLVIYSSEGKFLRTIQTRNLTCALYFDPRGQLWMASGQDGQILKLDRDGDVIGAIGNGSGRGVGQFIEANYMAMDASGNLYTGDTSVGRVTEMVAPR
jgi:sugar lactone lactonase YvrE